MASRRKCFLAAAIACSLAAVASPTPAQAQSAPGVPGFAFGAPAGEALLGIASIAAFALNQVPQRSTGWGPGAEHAYEKTADRASDLTGAYAGSALAIGVGYGLESAYFGNAGVKGGAIYALRAPLMDFEAAALTTGMVAVLKRVTGRCRPADFHAGSCDKGAVPDAFPSGHTAAIAAIAGNRLLLASRTEGDPGFRWGAFAMSETMALTTALLRVRAGKHSWTDVLGGFVLGHAVGVAVSLVHPMTRVDRKDLPGYDAFSMAWGGEF